MTETPEGDDELLTVREAMAKLKVSRTTLMNLIYAGELATIRMPSGNPGFRDGSKAEHRIEPAEIRRFIERNRQRVTA